MRGDAGWLRLDYHGAAGGRRRAVKQTVMGRAPARGNAELRRRGDLVVHHVMAVVVVRLRGGARAARRRREEQALAVVVRAGGRVRQVEAVLGAERRGYPRRGV